MNVSTRDCVVIEDSLPGVQAGLAAGMTVFALQPFGVHPEMPADAIVVEHLSALRGMAPFA